LINWYGSELGELGKKKEQYEESEARRMLCCNVYVGRGS
jgi:hypothetical protein